MMVIKIIWDLNQRGSITLAIICPFLNIYTFEHYNPHKMRIVFKGNVTDKSIKTHVLRANLHLCTFHKFTKRPLPKGGQLNHLSEVMLIAHLPEGSAMV